MKNDDGLDLHKGNIFLSILYENGGKFICCLHLTHVILQSIGQFLMRKRQFPAVVTGVTIKGN